LADRAELSAKKRRSVKKKRARETAGGIIYHKSLGIKVLKTERNAIRWVGFERQSVFQAGGTPASGGMCFPRGKNPVSKLVQDRELHEATFNVESENSTKSRFLQRVCNKPKRQSNQKKGQLFVERKDACSFRADGNSPPWPGEGLEEFCHTGGMDLGQEKRRRRSQKKKMKFREEGIPPWGGKTVTWSSQEKKKKQRSGRGAPTPRKS